MRSPLPIFCEATFIPMRTPPAPGWTMEQRSIRFETQPSRSHTPYSPMYATEHPRIAIRCAPSASTAALVCAAACPPGHSLGPNDESSPISPLGSPLIPLKPWRRGESENAKAMFSKTMSWTNVSFSGSPAMRRSVTSPGTGYWKRVVSSVSPGRGMYTIFFATPSYSHSPGSSSANGAFST